MGWNGVTLEVLLYKGRGTTGDGEEEGVWDVDGGEDSKWWRGGDDGGVEE